MNGPGVKTIQLDEAQRETMLRRLLASEQFRRKGTEAHLLRLFFQYAVDRAISADEIMAAPLMKHRHDPENAVRPEVSKLRRLLRLYFATNRGIEPIRATIPMAHYQLHFDDNTYEQLPSSALDRFWFPYTKDQLPISFTLAPLTCFRDSWPKTRDHGGRYVPPEPDKGHKMRPREDVYLPTGLMRALLIFSNFLGSKGVRCNLDVSDRQAPPDSNAIAIASPLDKEFRSHYIKFASHYVNERPGVIDTNDVADHFELKDGLPIFVCYARLLQVPIRRYAALRIEAYHSVAVEAAAGFLTSSDGIRRINEKLEALDDTRLGFCFGGDHLLSVSASRALG